MPKSKKFSLKINVDKVSDIFYFIMGLTFAATAIFIIIFSFRNLFSCFAEECDILNMLDFVGYMITAVAIFDVGRYLIHEEVVRDREMRSPKEARHSLTKFMVIIVIAVMLDALLSLARAGKELNLLVYPAALFFVATLLLMGLGLYVRLSISAEVASTDHFDKTSEQ